MSTKARGPHRPRRRGSRGRHVVVASRIYDPEPAAAAFRLKALVEALSSAGAQVTVLTTRTATPAPGRPRPGVRVRRWPVLRDRSGYVRGYLPYLSFDVPLALRLLLVRRPDVVVCEPPPTTGVVVRVVCRVRRIPYVYYAADIWSAATRAAGMPGAVPRILEALERWSMAGARDVISVSAGVTDRLAAWRLPGTVHTVGNGIDTEVFTPDGPRVEVPGRLLVYPGTASEVHGAGIFVDAMERVHAEVPDARLVFIGHGAEIGALKEAAERLPAGVVSFLPRQPPADVARWLRRADVALASVRPGQYGFAFPSKVYAAAACGAPVVFTGVGPARAVITRARLGLAVAYDRDRVAEAILQTLARPFEEGRARRARWAADSASLTAAGGRGATIILDPRARPGRLSTEQPNVHAE